MADKPKKQKAKPKKDAPGVLGSLSTARPERIGSRRARAAAVKPAPGSPTARTRARTTATTAAAKDAAQPTTGAKAGAAKTAAAKTAKPTATAAAKPAGAKATAKPVGAKATAKPKRAAKPRAAAPRTFEPTPAAEAAAASRPASPKPRPVRDAAPGIGARGDAETPAADRHAGPELAATAVKAAGEVAQLGLTIGGKLLKRAAERLPKP